MDTITESPDRPITRRYWIQSIILTMALCLLVSCAVHSVAVDADVTGGDFYVCLDTSTEDRCKREPSDVSQPPNSVDFE
jgi:hypothetical protein